MAIPEIPAAAVTSIPGVPVHTLITEMAVPVHLAIPEVLVPAHSAIPEVLVPVHSAILEMVVPSSRQINATAMSVRSKRNRCSIWRVFTGKSDKLDLRKCKRQSWVS